MPKPIKKSNIHIKQSAGIVDSKGKIIRNIDDLVGQISCDFFIDTDIPAIVMRDISTGALRYIVLEDNSLTIYDDRAAACAAKTA